MSLMKLSSLILVACGLLALQVSASLPLIPRREERLRVSYARMEEYLSKNWKGPVDVEKDIKMIDQCGEKCLPFIWKGRFELMYARERLDLLETLTEDESMCFFSGYDIVSEALRHTKGLPRLRQLVKHFIAKNAKYCEPVYSGLRGRRRDHILDSESRKDLKELTSILAEQLTGWTADQMTDNLEKAIDEGQNSTLNLYEFIQTKIVNNPKQLDLGNIMFEMTKKLYERDILPYIESYDQWRMSAKPDLFSGTIIEHALYPCSVFVREMNRRKQFEMAAVHSRVTRRNIHFVEHPQLHYSSSWDLVAFYKDWIRYEVCRTLVVRDGQEIYKIIKETRRKVLNIDPDDYDPDSHFIQTIRVSFPQPDECRDEDLFEPGEWPIILSPALNNTGD